MRLEIEYLPTESLVPYANNAKKHPDAQVKQIQASIERYEFSDVVGIWHNEEGQPEIVYGHGSVLAAKRMGMADVPCVCLDHLTDDQRRAYCHIHNQLTLNSELDYGLVAEEMAALDIDAAEFGFDLVNADDFGTDFTLDDSEEPKTKTITLQLTPRQYEVVATAMEAVEPVETGGNNCGNRIYEVCVQWAER